MTNSLPPNIREQLNGRCPCYAKLFNECDCEPAPNPELTEVAESLKAAISSLQDGYLVTEKKLDKSLHLAVIAAMNACQDVLDLLKVQSMNSSSPKELMSNQIEIQEETLNCHHCKHPHSDIDEWALKPHRTHLCLNCNQLFEGTFKGVSRPTFKKLEKPKNVVFVPF